MKTLQDWLSHLDAKQPAVRAAKSLDPVIEVANTLGLLPVKYAVVTVAGTNGKGTTANLLSSIYHHSGYKTGMYTSPHLLRFNERILLNGQEITDEDLVNAFEAVSIAAKDTHLNYYEYATLAALYYFKQQQVEIAILEVGLGGRLDATNIVDPTIAVITTIDLDHTQWLGEDRERIGAEKAGIFRESMPAVCGELDCPQSIIDIAQKLKVPLFRQQQDFFAIIDKDTWEWRCVDQIYKNLPIPQMPIQNAATVLMAARCLHEPFPVKPAAIEKALMTTRVMGRYQIFQLQCPVILDVAHNVGAVRWLSEKLKRMPCKGKTIGVFSVLADKDVSGMIAEIEPQIYRWFYSPLPLDRALSAEALDGAFDYSKYRRREVSIEVALEKALEIATPDDRIVAFGSIYVASYLLPILQAKTQAL